MNQERIEKALASIEDAREEQFKATIKAGIAAVENSFEKDPFQGLSNLVSLGALLEGDKFSDLDRELFNSSIENIALAISENCHIVLEHLNQKLEEPNGD